MTETAGIISTGQLITFKGERWIMEGLSRDGQSAFLRLLGNSGISLRVLVEELRQ